MVTRIMAALKGSIDRRTRIDTAFWLLGLVVVIVFLRWTATPGGSSRLADFLAWVKGQGAVGANISDYMPSRIETAQRMLEVAGVGPDRVFLDIARATAASSSSRPARGRRPSASTGRSCWSCWSSAPATTRRWRG